MEGRDPAREGPQVDDFGGVRQAILKNRARENPYTLGEDDVLGIKDMIGTNVKKLNNEQLNNKRRIAAEGEFGGTPQGELIVPGQNNQQILDDNIASKVKPDIKVEKKEGLASLGKKEKQPVATKTKPELSEFEQNIRAKEDALLKMLAGAEQRQLDRAAAAEKDATKSRYMQLANLGLGIMGATPEKNLLVTASKAAKDSKILENLQAINEKARNAKQDAEDKAFAAKTGLAKEELGVELNREERDQVRKAKAAEKKFKDKQLELMEAELGLKERELELEAINSGVDAKDYKFLSDEVDKLTSQKGMVKVGDRNIPITSQTEALLPQEYRRQLGNIKNYALRLLQQSGTIDNLIAQDGLNAINNEIDRIYREGFSQIDTQSLGTAASGNLGANQ